MRSILLAMALSILPLAADQQAKQVKIDAHEFSVPVGTIRVFKAGDNTVTVKTIFSHLLDNTLTMINSVNSVNDVSKESVLQLFCEECDENGLWRGGVRGQNAHRVLPGKIELGTKWNLRAEGGEIQITELSRKVKIGAVEYDCVVVSDLANIEILLARGVGVLRVTRFDEDKEAGTKSSTVVLELASITKP